MTPASITPQELLQAIEEKNGFPLDPDQKRAIIHGDGPLLIIAGPGTGKTEVLVARCLKLLCCDRVEPHSIMMTTFTKKAANSIKSRLAQGLEKLQQRYPQLEEINTSPLRLGTLHSLADLLLREYNYPAYRNFRLLDEVGSAMLVDRRVIPNLTQGQRNALYEGFKPMWMKPGAWPFTLGVQNLLDRITDNRINPATLEQAGGKWTALAETYKIYHAALIEARAADFNHLLKAYLQFLEQKQAEYEAAGRAEGITHILVDEYQDTNPMQEAIYFQLAGAPPHNLTIVGDEDQALYRFRGGTMECMTEFPERCAAAWETEPEVIQLAANHRSTPEIVTWCNHYLESFPTMQKPSARSEGKEPLYATRQSPAYYPQLSVIARNSIGRTAQELAKLVQELKAAGTIKDYNQCALLMGSTKRTVKNAGPFHEALEEAGIPIYNPRAKDYHEQPEIAQAMGALLTLLGAKQQTMWSQSVQSMKTAYQSIAHENAELQRYVEQSRANIMKKEAGARIGPTASDMLYRILQLKPFTTYRQDPVQDARLAKLTQILETFLKEYGRNLRIDQEHPGEINRWWLSRFQKGLCEYLVEQDLNQDDEEEIQPAPSGQFPIMTVHQAKGLEFDIVFAANSWMETQNRTDGSCILQEELHQFSQNGRKRWPNAEEVSLQDRIRKHYVSYSRAKQALILLTENKQLAKEKPYPAFGGRNSEWCRNYFQPL